MPRVLCGATRALTVHAQLKEQVRKFVDDEIAPRAAEIDQKNEVRGERVKGK